MASETRVTALQRCQGLASRLTYRIFKTHQNATSNRYLSTFYQKQHNKNKHKLPKNLHLLRLYIILAAYF